MTTKKHIAALLLAMAFCTAATAQDSTAVRRMRDSLAMKRIKEFYLSPLSFSPLQLQLQYKQQVGTNTLLKFSLLNLYYLQSHNSNPNGNTQDITVSSGGIGFGLEFRKHLYNRFTFFHGPNVSFGVNSNFNKINYAGGGYTTRTITNYNAAIPYTLGFLFSINQHFFVAAELNPSVYYITQNGNADNYNIGVSFSSNSGIFSLVYRL